MFAHCIWTNEGNQYTYCVTLETSLNSEMFYFSDGGDASTKLASRYCEEKTLLIHYHQLLHTYTGINY